MYGDAAGKYVTKNDIYNNPTSLLSHNNMSKPNRICKGKCVQFKATKPVNRGRYESGQYRCQTCEIFITKHGVNGQSCRCCNMRVRSKPRNSSYKEKYHDKVRNAKDSGINVDENGNIEPTKENKTPDIGEEKKSTPIYEEIDDSIKTYYEFKEFLDTVKLESNYQIVMLKELLEYGKLHLGEISESLAYFNNKNTLDIESVKYYFDVSAYDILLARGFVTEGKSVFDLPSYSLNVHLKDFQRIELIERLSNEILKYNQEHDIPENQFPDANNMNNIFWPDFDGKRSSKAQKIKNPNKKIHSTPANSSWIWSVTNENLEIIKSQNIWGSSASKERIGSRIKSGDRVVFYVIGSSCFKGSFEFVGEWYDSPNRIWERDLEPDGSLRYKSQVKLKSIQLGSVSVLDLYEKIKLFIGKSQNARNLLLQGNHGYPSNNGKPLLEGDFEIIKECLSKSLLVAEPAVTQSDSRNLKECPKCHVRIEDSSNIIFEHLIEEIFGYRQSDSNDPQGKKPQSYCRECRSSKNVSTSEKSDVSEPQSQNDRRVKIFDYKDGTLNIKNCKIESTDVITKDQILTNDDIVSKFKVGNMGGIRYQKETSIIVLLSTHSNDYDNTIDTDSGLIVYTGKGHGDQELKNGNEKILNSQNTPMVFFKEVYQEPGTRPRGMLDSRYQFVGTVKYQRHYWKTEKGRKVLKFVLEIRS